MFSIPFISGVPIPSVFGGTLVVPGAGALIAMVLIAALVGSALGLLRQATTPHTNTSGFEGKIAYPCVDHDDHHGHREAA